MGQVFLRKKEQDRTRISGVSTAPDRALGKLPLTPQDSDTSCFMSFEVPPKTSLWKPDSTVWLLWVKFPMSSQCILERGGWVLPCTHWDPCFSVLITFAFSSGPYLLFSSFSSSTYFNIFIWCLSSYSKVKSRIPIDHWFPHCMYVYKGMWVFGGIDHLLEGDFDFSKLCLVIFLKDNNFNLRYLK